MWFVVGLLLVVVVVDIQKKKYELKDCTFVPELSKETANMTKDASSTDATPIWERLYEEATDERKVRFI